MNSNKVHFAMILLLVSIILVIGNVVQIVQLHIPLGIIIFASEIEKLLGFLTEEKGLGLKTMVEIKKGNFIIKYVGMMLEQINLNLLLAKKQNNKNPKAYLLQVYSKLNIYINAYQYDSIACYMNYSYELNCKIINWEVGNDYRASFFALEDIQSRTELTLKYQWESSYDLLKTNFFCGSSKCNNFINISEKNESNSNKNIDMDITDSLNHILIPKKYKIMLPVIPMLFYNLRNICYINSALQMLFSIPPFFSIRRKSFGCIFFINQIKYYT